MTVTIQEICQYLESFAPRRLSEDWDNVGFLLGHRGGPARCIMTCLTITPEVVEEAVAKAVNLIVSHHPFPFKGVKRITTDTANGQMLVDLIKGDIAVYSPHTAFDSTVGGINEQLAGLVGIQSPQCLRPSLDDPTMGAGRYGKLGSPQTLRGLAESLKSRLGIPSVAFIGNPDAVVDKVAVACGAAGDFLGAATAKGCNGFITGETNFHTCLSAKAQEVGLILLGHYASERFAVVNLAEKLALEFSNLTVFASDQDQDPIQRV